MNTNQVLLMNAIQTKHVRYEMFYSTMQKQKITFKEIIIDGSKEWK